MEEPKLAVEAVIEAFATGAMTDHYDSGAVVSYDASRLRVESPEPFVNRHLVIFHDEELPAESPWREIGRRIRFKMRESSFAAESVLFTASAAELQSLPRENEK